MCKKEQGFTQVNGIKPKAVASLCAEAKVYIKGLLYYDEGNISCRHVIPI